MKRRDLLKWAAGLPLVGLLPGLRGLAEDKDPITIQPPTDAGIERNLALHIVLTGLTLDITEPRRMIEGRPGGNAAFTRYFQDFYDKFLPYAPLHHDVNNHRYMFLRGDDPVVMCSRDIFYSKNEDVGIIGLPWAAFRVLSGFGRRATLYGRQQFDDAIRSARWLIEAYPQHANAPQWQRTVMRMKLLRDATWPRIEGNILPYSPRSIKEMTDRMARIDEA